jgi:hypothetical protein
VVFSKSAAFPVRPAQDAGAGLPADSVEDMRAATHIVGLAA